MITFPGTLTGTAITGLTSPTYTLTTDIAPDTSNGKQVAVTALGGTQAGVTTHTVSSPFTITASRPKNAKLPVIGATPSASVVPVNTSVVRIRKGVTPFSGALPRIAQVRIEIDVPAGAETFDKANLDAMFSAAIGVLVNQAQGLRDTVGTNIL